MRPRVVLVAPDKFKGSLRAGAVAEALASGLEGGEHGEHGEHGLRAVRAPIADGGEGTVDAAVAAGWTPVRVTTSGPTGLPVEATYARRDDSAVVELAGACGIALLPPGALAPMMATSSGLGDAIAAAVGEGARRIVVGIGGSASTDGGAGMLARLGARLLDADEHEIAPAPASLTRLARVDLAPLHERMDGIEVVVACDVDNPLLGEAGAARVYGPQKGASSAQVVELDDTLRHFADVLAAATGTDPRDVPGAGAAGGVGFGAMAALGATVRSGIDLVLGLAGFDRRLAEADLVITGEGALDTQTLQGKAPAGVARAARAAGIPVIAVCGQNSLSDDELRAAGIDAVYALTDLEPDVDRCLAEPVPLLRQIGEQIASQLTQTRLDTEGAAR